MILLLGVNLLNLQSECNCSSIKEQKTIQAFFHQSRLKICSIKSQVIIVIIMIRSWSSGNVYGQLSAFAYKLTLVGPRFESQSRLSDGDVKGRSPDVNKHI